MRPWHPIPACQPIESTIAAAFPVTGTLSLSLWSLSLLLYLHIAGSERAHPHNNRAPILSQVPTAKFVRSSTCFNDSVSSWLGSGLCYRKCNFRGQVIDLSLAFLAAAKAGSVRMAGTSLVHSPHAWPRTDCKPTCAPKKRTKIPPLVHFNFFKRGAMWFQA